MENRTCLLGFSGSILSLIFSTLNGLRHSKEVVIVENIKVEDEVSFECNIPYSRIWYEDFKVKEGDEFAFSLMRPAFKKIVYELFLNQHMVSKERYINILHPSLIAAANCTLEKGIYAEPGCVISPYAQIGFGVSINRGCTIGHHAVLKDFCTINPGVDIAGHCTIGSSTSIGIGTTIFDHVNVGSNTVIGGGSVVTQNIPDGVLRMVIHAKLLNNFLEPATR